MERGENELGRRKNIPAATNFTTRHAFFMTKFLLYLLYGFGNCQCMHNYYSTVSEIAMASSLYE